jgi:hypothetical protein
MRQRPRSSRSKVRKAKSKRDSIEIQRLRPSERGSSKRNSFSTRNLSTTSVMLSRSNSARKSTNLPVSLRRTNCSPRRRSTKKHRRRSVYRTD